MGIQTPKPLKEIIETLQDEIGEFIGAIKKQVAGIIPINRESLSRDEILLLLEEENCSIKTYDYFIKNTGKNMRSILFAHMNFWKYFYALKGPHFQEYDFSHSVMPLILELDIAPQFEKCNLEGTIFINKLDERYHEVVFPGSRINKFTRLMRGSDCVEIGDKKGVTTNENILLHEEFSSEYDDFEALHFEKYFTLEQYIARKFSFGAQEGKLYCFKKDEKYFFALNQNVFVNQGVLKKGYIYEATGFNDELLQNDMIDFYDMIPNFGMLEIRPVRMLDVHNEEIKEYF